MTDISSKAWRIQYVFAAREFLLTEKCSGETRYVSTQYVNKSYLLTSTEEQFDRYCASLFIATYPS